MNIASTPATRWSMRDIEAVRSAFQLPEPDDLEAEHRAYCDAICQRHLNALSAMLGRQALADAAAEGLIGLGRISADEAYFWPDIEGREAFILPVQEKGATVDLIAWSPKRPTDWRWRLGSATILNLDAVMVTSWDMPPVKVHATPLDWLRAGRDGCVILDWSSPDIGWLTSLPAIEAEPMINAKIKRAILAMRLPRFVAARRNHEHAA